MATKSNITRLLKQSLLLSAEIVIFSETLERVGKTAIANKITESAIKMNKFLFDAKSAVLKFDIKYKIEKAHNSANDIVYWLKQCQKSSNYPSDINLTEKALQMIEQISEQVNLTKEHHAT